MFVNECMKEEKDYDAKNNSLEKIKKGYNC